MDATEATTHAPPGRRADDRAEPQPTDRRQGEDRRGPLRACTGRRRADRRRAARAAGLLMAAVTLLPSLRNGAARRLDEASDQQLAAPRPGALPAAEEGSPFDAFIEEASALYGVSSDLVRAVIQTESGFDPKAVSGVGAKGLMQLMPRTARALGIKDPFDPKQNIFGGVKYLGMLLERNNGNVALALASYNAGPGNVAKHGGIPPFGETRGYVRKITGLLVDASEVPETAGQASGD